MKNRIVKYAVFIILMAAALRAAAAETRQVRIEWEAVRGAHGYIVEVKNQEGRELLRKTVTTSYAVMDVAPGAYKIRITALNVFLKPGSNSGWTDLAVKKKETPKEEPEGDSLAQIGKLGKDQQDALQEEALKREEALKKEEEIQREEARKKEEALRKEEQARRRAAGYPRGMAGLGPLDIAPGGSCHFPVTRWSRYLRFSPGGHLMLSYRLSGIEAVKNTPVLSNFGLALQFSVVPFTGETRNGNKMNLMVFSPGFGVFYDFKLGLVSKWAFDLRLAFFTGPSFSQQEVRGLFPKNNLITKVYYDPQLSFRFVYGGYFFIETGCGLQSVLFSGEALSTVYPFLRLGIRL
ncbi:MAG TPA: hypothetical protein PLM53_06315 [Spirochaetota bacterium]|nr:hypothetical protein [Spirochaetota bacterium]HPC39707.1 hypothetical protein [Spirochaetota bacterium]HPL18776.1 hypothetical protein [Spirochaetota bacterium]HQF07435.1 hypothetical protein [Spirochaetota bacterium]HQH96695.1 hypothetical protein [Spirochaetota bacterium]